MIKKSYNKSDIIKRASYKLNIPNEELKIIFDSFMDVVSGMLKESNDRIHVEIRNFGSFDVIPTNSRTPPSKSKVVIAADSFSNFLISVAAKDSGKITSSIPIVFKSKASFL